jgi:hypothetical protein
MGFCPLETNGLGLGRETLDLDRIMGAAAEDPAACVVFERFIGRLWSCGRVSESGADTECHRLLIPAATVLVGAEGRF